MNEIGHYMPEGFDVRGIALFGSLANHAAGYPGLAVVVDISSPARTREIGVFNTPRTARAANVGSLYAYVGDLRTLRV